MRKLSILGAAGRKTGGLFSFLKFPLRASEDMLWVSKGCLEFVTDELAMRRKDEWVKFRKKLLHDVRVTLMSRACGVHRHTVIGGLLALWSLADDEVGCDGHLRNLSADDLDLILEIPGFTKALPADWCEIKDGRIYLPNYLEHNGSTAKTRDDQARRARTSRACKQDTDNMSRAGAPKNKNKKENTTPPKSPSEGDGVATTTNTPNGFEVFWAHYPRRVQKADAIKAWGKLSPSEDLQRTILQALQAQARSEQWTRDGGAYIPYPATWLNGRRWEDELFTTPAEPVETVEEKLARQKRERDLANGVVPLAQAIKEVPSAARHS